MQLRPSSTAFIVISVTHVDFFHSLQSCLVGIIVPDPEIMPEWAKKRGLEGSYEDLCKNTVGGAWLKNKLTSRYAEY